MEAPTATLHGSFGEKRQSIGNHITSICEKRIMDKGNRRNRKNTTQHHERPKQIGPTSRSFRKKNGIQEGMKDPRLIDLDIKEKRIMGGPKLVINNRDVIMSQGCLGNGPGHWKPLLNGESDESAMLNILSEIATDDVPTNMRDMLMTGILMAQDKDGKRVRPIIIPSFVRRASLSVIGGCLNSEAAEQIGPTHMGMGTPDGCPLFRTHEGVGCGRHNETHIINRRRGSPFNNQQE